MFSRLKSLSKSLSKTLSTGILSSLVFVSFATASPVWYGFNTGYSVAKQENKPVMLYVFQEDCEYCELMSQTTLRSKVVQHYLEKHYVTTYANLSTHKGREIGRHFIVLGTPTTIFINPKTNTVITRAFGMQTPTEFVSILQRVCEVARKQGLNC